MQNIARIEAYTAGTDVDAFVADTRTADAVERCLARISEAAVKLGDDAEQLCREIPWRDIRSLGNRLRHAYTTVDVTRIWLIVDKDMTTLKEACRNALGRIARGNAV